MVLIATVVPGDLIATRQTLHRVAAHVLGRRRHAVTGRFGLRASPGGFATPAFGPDAEIVRVAGGSVVRETGKTAAYLSIAGSSLRSLAAFAGADVEAAFSVGAETPALGDVDEPLALPAEPAGVLAGWFALGWQVLDQVVAELPPSAAPAVVQLWPEHFDAGTDVGVGAGSGARVNLGASAGDSFCEEPYLYVGPWGPDRPGPADFWNASFGAVMARHELLGATDGVAAGVAFLRTGLAYLGGTDHP
jgi:hypothetical protein